MTPRNPNFAQAIRESFAKQTFMQTIGATLTRIQAGEVEISLPSRADLLQQHGFMHAGALTTLVDTACGYAALSLMPANSEVLSVEFKMNLLAPGIGKNFNAVGKVVKAGRTITVVNGEIHNEEEKLIATMTATMIRREI